MTPADAKKIVLASTGRAAPPAHHADERAVSVCSGGLGAPGGDWPVLCDTEARAAGQWITSMITQSRLRVPNGAVHFVEEPAVMPVFITMADFGGSHRHVATRYTMHARVTFGPREPDEDAPVVFEPEYATVKEQA